MNARFCCSLLAMIAFSSLNSEETLNDYLVKNNVDVTEGYCTKPQEEQFISSLRSYSSIKKIAEIGFNAGHSSELFLKTCPEASVTSFDINTHDYTAIGLAYMKQKYKERLTFVPGNSIMTIPLYSSTHISDCFDLIYIDGDHSYQGCLADIINCKLLSNKNTVVWVDDYNFPSVQQAIQECVQKGLVKIVAQNRSYDPKHYWREWVELRYIQ